MSSCVSQNCKGGSPCCESSTRNAAPAFVEYAAAVAARHMWLYFDQSLRSSGAVAMPDIRIAADKPFSKWALLHSHEKIATDKAYAAILPYPSKTCSTLNQLEFRPCRFANATRGTRRVGSRPANWQLHPAASPLACFILTHVQPRPGKMSPVGKGMEHARALVF